MPPNRPILSTLYFLPDEKNGICHTDREAVTSCSCFLSQPERIDPKKSSGGYDIRSDVWSLGISLTELATGKFPYPRWNSMFEQLQQVVAGDPPRLEDPNLSAHCREFVNLCLTKEVKDRPKYNKLLVRIKLIALWYMYFI